VNIFQNKVKFIYRICILLIEMINVKTLQGESLAIEEYSFLVSGT